MRIALVYYFGNGNILAQLYKAVEIISQKLGSQVVPM
jgi:hypothetical protein